MSKPYEHRSEQPCWTCAKAYGGCSWSKNFTPVPGWIAEKRRYTEKEFSDRRKNVDRVTYAIEYCPEFERENRYG